MAEPVKVKARVKEVKYVKEAKSLAFLLQCEKGEWLAQIHRDNIATFGNRTEKEINAAMEKYAETMRDIYVGKDKFVNAVFDEDLDAKIKDHFPLKY